MPDKCGWNISAAFYIDYNPLFRKMKLPDKGFKMQKLQYIAVVTGIITAFSAHAGEWDWDVSGHAQGLYGYTEAPQRFDEHNKFNNGNGSGEINFSSAYAFDDDYAVSMNLDINGGIDQELESYNQGRWGEEAYAIGDTPYGRIMLGQTYNVDAQLSEGAPNVGALSSNNQVVNFISNPNWKRNGKTTKFATLNTTYINTDGVAPKISYISPDFYDTVIGVSYIPEIYNRRGLVSKYADYKNADGWVASIYTTRDLEIVELKASTGYAQFNNDDKEISINAQLTRGNWSLGGGFRKTYIDGQHERTEPVTPQAPELFDGYREGEAWNVGIGYEIGPFKSSVSYFEAKAVNSDNKDKIIAFSNQYQLSKYAEIYAAVAHADFEGADHSKADNNQGYATIVGLGLKF